MKWSSDEPNKLLVAEKKGIIRLYNVEQEQPLLSSCCEKHKLILAVPSFGVRLTILTRSYSLIVDH